MDAVERAIKRKKIRNAFLWVFFITLWSVQVIAMIVLLVMRIFHLGIFTNF